MSIFLVTMNEVYMELNAITAMSVPSRACKFQQGFAFSILMLKYCYNFNDSLDGWERFTVICMSIFVF